jgi:hypothetical protein
MSASRQRDYRRRRQSGRAVLSVELDVGAVAEWLIDEGLLAEWDANDRDAISDALRRAIDALRVVRLSESHVLCQLRKRS